MKKKIYQFNYFFTVKKEGLTLPFCGFGYDKIRFKKFERNLSVSG